MLWHVKEGGTEEDMLTDTGLSHPPLRLPKCSSRGVSEKEKG